MINLYVPDVGDGLAAGIRTIDGCSIQIDCGSQQDPAAAYWKGLLRIRPSIFFLSHFHVDHYNGLFGCERSPIWPKAQIEKVFFPRIPRFPDSEIFLRCMFAMNHRVMGNTTGSMEVDFLRLMQSLNGEAFDYRALSSGDRINLGGTEFEVLWPPRVIKIRQVLKVIGKAIEDFSTAKAEDPVLNNIYESLGDSKEMRPYSSIEGGMLTASPDGRPGDSSVSPRADLPEVVKQANKSLRAAANHLSLAFRSGNRMLFMADLEPYEIRKVVRTLQNQELVHFLALITPHHGTHWHKDLSNLRAWWAVSSIGNRLIEKASSNFKMISDQSLFTHLTGDIEIPLVAPPSWCRPCPLGHRGMFL